MPITTASRVPTARTEPTDARGGRRPIMLAVAGDSAAGKTTLAEGILAILGPDRVTTMCTDDYHRFDREQRAARGITPLHPQCNYIDILEQHMEQLAHGMPILKPVYGHGGGTIDPPEYIEPKEFVVVEGLLPLYTPRLRRCFDTTVYLDPPEEMRVRWKVARDCAKRGYRPEQVLAELQRREPDSDRFIRPQRGFADIVVRFSPPVARGATDDAHLDVSIVIRPTSAHPDLSGVVSEAGAIRLRLGRDAGRPVDFLEIDGCVPDRAAATLETALWDRIGGTPGLRRRPIGAFAQGTHVRISHPLALAQLLIVGNMMTAAVPS
ncbi:MAG TPA: phosphoribulokinase [Actinomycetota bacterium]